MSRLIYNGVELSYIATQSISQTPVMDESDTDVMYWRWHLRVSSLFVPGPDRLFDPAGGTLNTPFEQGETCSDAMARVRHHLGTPRRTLVYWAGSSGDSGDPNKALIYVAEDPSGETTPDAANGPKPRVLDIREVSDGKFLVLFEIETCVVDCPNQLNNSPGDIRKAWVAHRWNEGQQIDDAGMTIELTRRGRIVARSDMVANADVLRSLVTPLPPEGFRWKRVSYRLREDGLALEYDFAWEEVYLQPPSPAMEAEGEYSETYANACERWGECWVRLKGPNKVDKIKLLVLALSICQVKMYGQEFVDLKDPKNKDVFLGAIAVKESLYDPIVEARIRNRLKFDAKKQIVNNVFNLPTRQFSPRLVTSGPERKGQAKEDITKDELPGTPNPELVKRPNPYPPRGTASIRLVASALHDPCGSRLDYQWPSEQILSTLAVQVDLTNKYPEREDRIEKPNTSQGSFGNLQGTTQVSGDAVPVTVNIYPAASELDIKTDGKVGDADTGVYHSWSARKRFTQERFHAVMPVCKTGEKAQVVELAPPIHYCGISVRAVKTNGPPRLPDPKKFPDGWVLIGDPEIMPDDPVVHADGRSIMYGVTARYLFVISDPAKVDMTPALPPYHKFEADDFKESFKLQTSDSMFPSVTGAPTMAKVFPQPGDSTVTVDTPTTQTTEINNAGQLPGGAGNAAQV